MKRVRSWAVPGAASVLTHIRDDGGSKDNREKGGAEGEGGKEEGREREGTVKAEPCYAFHACKWVEAVAFSSHRAQSP